MRWGCQGVTYFRAAAQTTMEFAMSLAAAVVNPTLVSALGRHWSVLPNELGEHNGLHTAHSVTHEDIHTASCATTCLPGGPANAGSGDPSLCWDSASP
jgi:hypothetical protein